MVCWTAPLYLERGWLHFRMYFFAWHSHSMSKDVEWSYCKRNAQLSREVLRSYIFLPVTQMIYSADLLRSPNSEICQHSKDKQHQKDEPEVRAWAGSKQTPSHGERSSYPLAMSWPVRTWRYAGFLDKSAKRQIRWSHGPHSCYKELQNFDTD